MRKLALVALTFLLLSLHPADARALAAGTTIPWVGGNWYLFGADYLWDNYGNDSESNAWGAYGCIRPPRTGRSTPTSRAWPPRASTRRGGGSSPTGMPTGIDQYVLPDLDAAVQITARHGIYLDLVLLDVSFMQTAQMVNGVQIGVMPAVPAVSGYWAGWDIAKDTWGAWLVSASAGIRR